MIVSVSVSVWGEGQEKHTLAARDSTTQDSSAFFLHSFSSSTRPLLAHTDGKMAISPHTAVLHYGDVTRPWWRAFREHERLAAAAAASQSTTYEAITNFTPNPAGPSLTTSTRGNIAFRWPFTYKDSWSSDYQCAARVAYRAEDGSVKMSFRQEDTRPGVNTMVAMWAGPAYVIPGRPARMAGVIGVGITSPPEHGDNSVSVGAGVSSTSSCAVSDLHAVVHRALPGGLGTGSLGASVTVAGSAEGPPPASLTVAWRNDRARRSMFTRGNLSAYATLHSDLSACAGVRQEWGLWPSESSLFYQVSTAVEATRDSGVRMAVSARHRYGHLRAAWDPRFLSLQGDLGVASSARLGLSCGISLPSEADACSPNYSRGGLLGATPKLGISLTLGDEV